MPELEYRKRDHSVAGADTFDLDALIAHEDFAAIIRKLPDWTAPRGVMLDALSSNLEKLSSAERATLASEIRAFFSIQGYGKWPLLATQLQRRPEDLLRHYEQAGPLLELTPELVMLAQHVRTPQQRRRLLRLLCTEASADWTIGRRAAGLADLLTLFVDRYELSPRDLMADYEALRPTMFGPMAAWFELTLARLRVGMGEANVTDEAATARRVLGAFESVPEDATQFAYFTAWLALWINLALVDWEAADGDALRARLLQGMQTEGHLFWRRHLVSLMVANGEFKALAELWATQRSLSTIEAYLLAQVEASWGEYAAAVERLQERCEATPWDEDAWRHLRSLFVEAGDDRRAEQVDRSLAWHGFNHSYLPMLDGKPLLDAWAPAVRNRPVSEVLEKMNHWPVNDLQREEEFEALLPTLDGGTISVDLLEFATLLRLAELGEPERVAPRLKQVMAGLVAYAWEPGQRLQLIRVMDELDAWSESMVRSFIASAEGLGERRELTVILSQKLFAKGRSEPTDLQELGSMIVNEATRTGVRSRRLMAAWLAAMKPASAEEEFVRDLALAVLRYQHWRDRIREQGRDQLREQAGALLGRLSPAAEAIVPNARGLLEQMLSALEPDLAREPTLSERVRQYISAWPRYEAFSMADDEAEAAHAIAAEFARKSGPDRRWRCAKFLARFCGDFTLLRATEDTVFPTPELEEKSAILQGGGFRAEAYDLLARIPDRERSDGTWRLMILTAPDRESCRALLQARAFEYAPARFVAACIQRGDPDLAVDRIHQLANARHRHRLLWQIAEAYAENCDWPAALATAIDATTHNRWAGDNYAEMLEHEDPRPVSALAGEHAPAQLHRALADRFLALGDAEFAQHHFRILLNQNPNDVSARQGLIPTLSSQDALRELRKLHAMAPEHVDFADFAKRLREAGEVEEAARAAGSLGEFE